MPTTVQGSSVCSFASADGNTPAIDGFMDHVPPLSAENKALVATAAKRLNERQFMVAAGGARLHEVGDAGAARAEDYQRAIGPQSAAILLIPPSGFLTTANDSNGASLAELAEFIDPADVELLEAAGVPEHKE